MAKGGQTATASAPDRAYHALMAELGHPGWTLDRTRGPGESASSPGKGGAASAKAEQGVAGFDFTFRHPRTGKDISARGLLGALRAGGITVHPWGQEGDDSFLQTLQLQIHGTGPLGGGPLGDGGPFGGGGGDVEDDDDIRSLRFGVDRAQFPWPDTGDPAHPGTLPPGSEDQYGSCWDVLRHVAALRGGFFREAVTSDLIWHHIFPYEENGDSVQSKPGQIPEPTNILLALQDDDYAALWRFSWVLFAAILLRVRIFPKVFARGGGEGLNSDPHADKTVTIFDPAAQVIIPETGEYAPARGDASWAEIDYGKPDHQITAIIPSVWGWHDWYYVGTETDADGNRLYDVRRLPQSDPGRRTSNTFQKYAINVYNPDPSDPTTPAGIDTFEGMVAVRKTLGLAAFGKGIGGALARWDSILGAFGIALTDYVPHLELGAEMDEQWGQLEEGTGTESFGIMSDYEVDVLEGTNLFRASAREYARFHAVLAASIQDEWPSARFKASEISSWASVFQSKGRSAWLGWALTEGLSAEVTLINQVLIVRRGNMPELRGIAAVADFMAVEDPWGFVFPAVDVSPVSSTRLVSVVGFHFFHYWAPDADADITGDLGYQNETDVWQYTLDPFLRLVVDACAVASMPVTWGVGNVGFPSENLEVLDAYEKMHLSAYGSSDQMVQAQTLVRLLLTFWAYGADNVLWFSHMGARSELSAGEFSMMGLRNDQLVAADAEVPSASSEDGAWAKSSWWAFQRISTLADRARSAAVVYNNGGLVVLRLTADSRGFLEVGTSSTDTWKYAFVFWLDGPGANVTRTDATLRLAVPDGFSRVPLVPENTCYARSIQHPVYAASSAPRWGTDPADSPDPMRRFGHCNQRIGLVTPHGSIDIQIGPTRDDSASAPADLNPRNLGIVAWLTNGDTCTVVDETPPLSSPWEVPFP